MVEVWVIYVVWGECVVVWVMFCDVRRLVCAYVVMMRNEIIIMCAWLVEGVVLYVNVCVGAFTPSVVFLVISVYPLFICRREVHNRCISIIHEYVMCMPFM